MGNSCLGDPGRSGKNGSLTGGLRLIRHAQVGGDRRCRFCLTYSFLPKFVGLSFAPQLFEVTAWAIWKIATNP